MFQGCVKEVLRVCKGRLRGASRNLEGWFKGTSRLSKRSSKDVGLNWVNYYAEDMNSILNEKVSKLVKYHLKLRPKNSSENKFSWLINKDRIMNFGLVMHG